MLPSTLTWILSVDGKFLSPAEFDALDESPTNNEIVGFGIKCDEGEKFCLGFDFWNFVGGEESRIKAICFYDLADGPLSLVRTATSSGKRAEACRQPKEYWFKILNACGGCDGESYCFPEISPRVPKVRTKPLPSDVILSDYYPYEFKLTDFQVVEHDLDDGREWHVGRVVSVSEGCQHVKPDELIAVCIWYDYHFSEEGRSAAVGIRRVIRFENGVAVLGEPLGKGGLEW